MEKIQKRVLGKGSHKTLEGRFQYREINLSKINVLMQLNINVKHLVFP